MLKTQDREIDGRRYTTLQLAPMKAFVLSKRLVPLVAPLLTGGTAGIEGFAEQFSKLSDDEAVKLALQVLANTRVVVDGEIVELASEKDINHAFSGCFLSLPKAMWFAIEVNFFPTGVADLIASSRAMKTPNPST